MEIDGEHYWDGGLVSNTPLSHVLDEPSRDATRWRSRSTCSARAVRCRATLLDVEERAKDIRYSSRTRAVTQQLERERHLRRLLREVLAHVPAARRDNAWCAEARTQATDKQFNVVHLIYQEKAWDGQHKDYEFSALSMREHWASGLEDIRRTLAHPHWLAPPEPERSSVTHDVHRERQ